MNSYRSSFVAAKPWCFSVLLSCGVAIGLMSACSTSDTGTTNDNANGNTNTNTNGNGTDPNKNENSDDRSGQVFTIEFEGAEAGISSGVSEFTYEGASFSGGTVRTVGQTDLYSPNSFFSYEVPNVGTVSIMFEEPVDLLSLFFVTNGTGPTVLTALDAEGNEVGTITAAQPGSGDENQTVPLSANAVRAEAVHSGDGEGWIDDFTFRYADSGPASGT